MARTKPAKWVDANGARAAVAQVTAAITTWLTVDGYEVKPSPNSGDEWRGRLWVTKPGQSDIATVEVDTVRAPGYGVGEYHSGPIQYMPAARVSVGQAPGQKDVWAKFDADESGVRPAAGDGYVRILAGVQTGIAAAERGNAYRAESAEAFAAVKSVIKAKPIHRDILAQGLDVTADTVGREAMVKIHCRPEQFDAIWTAVRSVLHRMSDRCECGDALPLGQPVCLTCAQGIARKVTDDINSALRVLPRFKLDYDERPDLKALMES